MFTTMITAVILLSQSCSLVYTSNLFQELGFTSDTVAPNVLLISAETSRFRQVFGVEYEQSDAEGVFFIIDDQKTRSLPLEKVPDIIRKCILAIEFEEPIAFGPTDY